jgi:hypothetical protein
VEPVSEPLRLFGAASEDPPLEWTWVDDQLAAAGTYWLVAATDRHPHPRPVWGVWLGGVLQLSVGGPVLRRQLVASPEVTVHLDSGTDVVIVEGWAGETSPDEHAAAIAAYDAKYDWQYTIDEYGPLTTVRPQRVLAWRSGGWAGRDGFTQVGRWRAGDD